MRNLSDGLLYEQLSDDGTGNVWKTDQIDAFGQDNIGLYKLLTTKVFKSGQVKDIIFGDDGDVICSETNRNSYNSHFTIYVTYQMQIAQNIFGPFGLQGEMYQQVVDYFTSLQEYSRGQILWIPHDYVIYLINNMKYVSKENLEQYDSLIKQYIQDKANDVELLAYGVEWDSTVANPEVTRIGNPLLHKQLPIQSAMRGCICQDDKIMYYLNPDNWYLKESDNKEFSGTASWALRQDIAVGTKGDTVRAKKFDLVLGFDGYTIDSSSFDTKLIPDPGQYIMIYKPENPNIYAVYITYETVSYYETGKLRFPESLEVFNNGLEIEDGTAVTIVFGANHSGYDGTVQVEIPEWYLWSEVDGNKRRVWCSLNKVVPYAQKIPHMLMDAHRNTVLRSTTTGMGYLDTLPANSAICVTNYQPYCRGGINNSAYDSKLYTYPEMSDLGKPVSGMARATQRTWCKMLIENLYAMNIIKHSLCGYM